MLEYLIKEAKRRDYAKVTLEVREDNQGAQTLYPSFRTPKKHLTQQWYT